LVLKLRVALTPIQISRPKDPGLRRATRSSKHKVFCLKHQMASDHSGCPIWHEGPHFGVRNDSPLFEEAPPQLLEGEQWLADLAYIKFKNNLICQTEGRLSPLQKDWYKATIEHTNGWAKHRRILVGIYRRRLEKSIDFLGHVIKIIINIASSQGEYIIEW